ncbi:sugar phosphate isomerase/epimerase [Phaeobacter sp. B1627]|uniref:sugar phosphate isomerase/epimerase family protein n=1 Tax=Phaeobacter sp. B1627 TaxID=2583809 RepID=UPI0011195C99|nr:sugar phosphate isomerase/epimerase family protein [Phaeobacter sp. B1627]TNJ43271.1 sugar phosphate isomerase/epimerase [Phaeobacter sp. B1627]
MKLAAVTNEVAPLTSPNTLDTILKTAVEHGITTFEARTVEGKRFPLLTGDAWRVLKGARTEYGIEYSAASAGNLIGIPMGSDLVSLHKDQLWSMSMDMAEVISAPALITFAPQRSASDDAATFEQVVTLLGDMVDRAAARGINVQLENLPGTWADTSQSCLALMQAVDRPTFGYVWDTGNLYEAEKTTFEEGFERLKPYICNVHLKDGEFIDGKMTWKHYGTGQTNLKGQIDALKSIGYTGTLALEAARIPHIEGDFEASLAYLRTIL